LSIDTLLQSARQRYIYCAPKPKSTVYLPASSPAAAARVTLGDRPRQEKGTNKGAGAASLETAAAFPRHLLPHLTSQWAVTSYPTPTSRTDFATEPYSQAGSSSPDTQPPWRTRARPPPQPPPKKKPPPKKCRAPPPPLQRQSKP